MQGAESMAESMAEPTGTPELGRSARPHSGIGDRSNIGRAVPINPFSPEAVAAEAERAAAEEAAIGGAGIGRAGVGRASFGSNKNEWVDLGLAGSGGGPTGTGAVMAGGKDRRWSLDRGHSAASLGELTAPSRLRVCQLIQIHTFTNSFMSLASLGS
jgi:hypothetical protein